MRALFWSVQLLDGVETTRDHAQGRLAALLTSGGLTEVVIHRRFATPAGSLGLLSARPGPPTVPVTNAPPSLEAHTRPERVVVVVVRANAAGPPIGRLSRGWCTGSPP